MRGLLRSSPIRQPIRMIRPHNVGGEGVVASSAATTAMGLIANTTVGTSAAKLRMGQHFELPPLGCHTGARGLEAELFTDCLWKGGKSVG